MRLALSVHFVAFTARVRGEIRKRTTTNFSFSFLNLVLVSKNSIRGKFTEKWHIGRVGETATESEKTRSLFN